MTNYDEEAKQERKKAPTKRDEIKIARANKLDKFAAQCLLPWDMFLENLMKYNSFNNQETMGSNALQNLIRP